MEIVNKTAVITGATSGIGLVVAQYLAEKGYLLIVLGRSTDALGALSKKLRAINPDVQIKEIYCDLAHSKTVFNACKTIKESCKAIDLLLLNAGLWNFKFIESEDRIEETFQVNLLSQMILFKELVEWMPQSKESKVIFTTSGLHQGKINFKDIEFRQNFSGFKAYRQSKLGMILLTRWLANQQEYSAISYYSVHPGMVNTKLGRNAGWLSRSIFEWFGKSKEEGAKTHIHLIEKDPKDLNSGEYYAKCRLVRTTSYSYNLDEAGRLWAVIQQYSNKLEEKI